ncbi:MAG TPA: hypothetical protein PLM38_11510, partial [Ottowia sp.]|nr:hypothetical protein [Ottowia sp.]
MFGIQLEPRQMGEVADVIRCQGHEKGTKKQQEPGCRGGCAAGAGDGDALLSRLWRNGPELGAICAKSRSFRIDSAVAGVWCWPAAQKGFSCLELSVGTSPPTWPSTSAPPTP